MCWDHASTAGDTPPRPVLPSALGAGIEIRNPVLLLTPGNTSQRGEGDLLEIAMQLRLRALPPMDMTF